MNRYKIVAPMHEQMSRFSFLGEEKTSNGTMLYGKAPHIGSKAFLHTIYPPLTDNEILSMGRIIGKKIPEHLANLYRECNGLHYFVDTLSIDGLRIGSGRNFDTFYQPYDLTTPNVDERLEDADDDFIFFGGYDWDGSLLYTKTKNKEIYLCSPDSSEPLKFWKSIEDFISYEAGRISALFDSNGIEIDKNKSSLPV
jgi:hypothetical protein